MRVLTVIVAALALSAPASAGKVVGIGEPQNGKTVTLHQGDTLAVALPSNPSTGYSWKIRAVDRRILALTGQSFVAPKTTLVGAPGVWVLVFRVQAKGRTTLRLAYVSPGTEATVGGRFSVTAVVR